MALLKPCRIEIIEPFTRVRDFDQDNELDGIELLMQAVNSQDNPGLQIVGNVRIELYEFVEASADPKGRRVDRWAVDLSSVELQQKHWSQLTQMYEFRLEVDPAVLPRKRKYVLAVTYDTPDGIHLMDECVLEYDMRGFSERVNLPTHVAERDDPQIAQIYADGFARDSLPCIMISFMGNKQENLRSSV